jgi:hypothetical protein
LSEFDRWDHIIASKGELRQDSRMDHQKILEEVELYL